MDRKRAVIAGCVGIAAIIGLAWKGDTALRLADYAFFDGPYLNRMIYQSSAVLREGGPDWSAILHDADLESHSWRRIDLSSADRLTVGYTPEELRAYTAFVEEFDALAAGSRHEHSFVVQLVHLVHEAYRNARFAPDVPDQTVFSRATYRAENHIFQLVNDRSACGTVGEATIALLRHLGFNTRLMGLAIDPAKIVFNHVFVEYYAPDLGKWVMLDPMVDGIPKSKAGVPLSAFEMMNDPAARAALNQAWDVAGDYRDWRTEGVYSPGSTIFFSTADAIRTTYLYSPRADVKEFLFAHEPKH